MKQKSPFVSSLMTVCLVVFLTVCSGYSLYAQGPTIPNGDHTPSSPEMWNFSRYGNNSNNLYTGTATVTIPIYHYSDNDFDIPVTLNYASNGLRVNTQANSVGLGWFLNVGGIITREVRDIPDEYDYYKDLPSINAWEYKWGYYEYCRYAAKSYANFPIFSNPLKSQERANSNYSDKLYYFRVNGQRTETSPDIFTFNFMGHSGSFMMGPDTIYVYNTQSPQGEYRINLAGLRYDTKNHNSSVIEITTGDGYIYTFGTTGADAAKFRDMHTTCNQFQKFPQYPKPTINIKTAFCCNAWLLTKITAPNERTVNFSYNSAEELSVCVQNGNYSRTTYNHDKSVGLLGSSEPRLMLFSNFVCQLASINIDNKCLIDFHYSDRLYKEKGFFPRESRQGYTNLDLEELATTKKVDSISVFYKARGIKTKFKSIALFYSSGGEFSVGNQVLLLREVRSRDANPEIYSMDYYADDQTYFPLHGYTGDHWGYFNNDYNNYFSYDGGVSVNKSTNVETITNTQRKPNMNGAILGMLQRVTYPTGGYSEYEYEGHDASQVLKRDMLNGHNNLPYLKPYDEQNYGNLVGGVRVKKVTDCSVIAGDSLKTTRSYSYKKSSDQSSGIVLHFPRYAMELTVKYNNEDNWYNYPVIYSSIHSLLDYTKDQSHIEYSDVTETFDDGSYIEYHFSNYEEVPDKHDFYVAGPTELSLTNSFTEPLMYNNLAREPVSMHMNRGKLWSKKSYNSSKQIVENHQFSYGLDNLPYHSRIDLANDYFYDHRTFIKSAPLVKQTVTQYLNGNTATEEVVYSYNNWGQLTGTEIKYPDGTKIKSASQYIIDVPVGKNYATNPTHQVMLDKNFVRYPVREQKSVIENNQRRLLEGKYYHFGQIPRCVNIPDDRDIFCVEYTQSTSLTQPEVISGADFIFDNLETDAEYQYYPGGKLKQIMRKDSITITYIWGYTGMHLVAEIKNASYEEVMEKLMNKLLENHQLPSDSEISNEEMMLYKLSYDIDLAVVESLRESLRTKAAITTLTYTPTGKLATMTDPSGRKVTYEYDPQDRLKAVKDDKGRKLNEYEYKYVTVGLP